MALCNLNSSYFSLVSSLLIPIVCTLLLCIFHVLWLLNVYIVCWSFCSCRWIGCCSGNVILGLYALWWWAASNGSLNHSRVRNTCSYSLLREVCPHFFFVYFSYALQSTPFSSRAFRLWHFSQTVFLIQWVSTFDRKSLTKLLTGNHEERFPLLLCLASSLLSILCFKGMWCKPNPT